MHKKYRIYWLGDALAFVLPRGRHPSTSPILSQSIKLLHLIIYGKDVHVPNINVNVPNTLLVFHYLVCNRTVQGTALMLE